MPLWNCQKNRIFGFPVSRRDSMHPGNGGWRRKVPAERSGKSGTLWRIIRNTLTGSSWLWSNCTIVSLSTAPQCQSRRFPLARRHGKGTLKSLISMATPKPSELMRGRRNPRKRNASLSSWKPRRYNQPSMLSGLWPRRMQRNARTTKSPRHRKFFQSSAQFADVDLPIY